MTSNMVMILAGILERLRYSFPEANQEIEPTPTKKKKEIEPTAKVNNVLRPVLEQLNKFIKNADENPELANGLDGTEIMRLAHSFEDSMELYMLGFKSRENGSTNKINYGVNEKLLSDAGRELRQACNFSVASLINIADEISSGSARQLYSYESDMVGMVDAEEELVTALTQGTEHLKLVSICGMPGIGKTTLALKIYDDLKIEQHFEVQAWVSVSQHMDRRDILFKIHSGVDSDAPEDALAECVHKFLKGVSYLVVLDDMPDADAWFCLRNCFPDNEKGSRILITTQLKDAAILVGGPESETHIHTMRLLTDKESSDLLRRELKEEEIEKFGNNIKSVSGGLPLAIVTLASSVKANSSKQWEWHLENLYSGSRDSPLFNVLDLSYRSLPIQMRACLLYLANYFTELAEIEMDTVCQLLIAEGLVVDKRNNGKKMMDVAADYLEELDNRCLIQILEEEEVEEQNNDVQPGERRFKSCRIHNVIERFCKSKKNNYEFVEAIDLKDENRGSISSTRVGIFLHEIEYSYDFLGEKPELIRSLLILNSSPSPPEYIGPREIPNPENFIRLRVLYLYAIDLKNGKLPKGMENLVHLRYLSFRDCYLKEMCSSVSNMFYLQTLDLRVRNEEVVTIHDHNVLNGLVSLRYLYLPPAYRTPKGKKLHLESLEKLELLDNFDASFCSVRDLLSMPNLMWVTVSTMGHVDETRINEIETILTFIGKNSGILRSMLLNLRDYDCYSEKRLSTLEKLFYSSSLHTLSIKGHIKKLRTFEARRMTGPSYLTKIVLNGSELVEDPMEILQLLPNLKILLLETEAYKGTEMKCSSSRFPKLRYLKLSKLYNLRDWQVEDQAMPKLCTLIIKECKNLGMLPEGLRFISNLKKLEIMSMPDTFVGTIQKPDQTEGEDFYKIKHVQPNVKVNGQILILKQRPRGQIVQVRQEPEDAELVVNNQTSDSYYGNWSEDYMS